MVYVLYGNVLKEKMCILVFFIKINWMKFIEFWKIYVNSLGFIIIFGKLKVFLKVYRFVI